MSLFKYVIIGAGVAYGIKEITKIREDGSTALDDITKDAPEWMEKAKEFATQTLENFKAGVYQQPTSTDYEESVKATVRLAPWR